MRGTIFYLAMRLVHNTYIAQLHASMYDSNRIAHIGSGTLPSPVGALPFPVPVEPYEEPPLAASSAAPGGLLLLPDVAVVSAGASGSEISSLGESF